MAKRPITFDGNQGLRSNSATLVYMERYLAPVHTRLANTERMQAHLSKLNRDFCKWQRLLAKVEKMIASIEATGQKVRTDMQKHNLQSLYGERKRFKKKIQQVTIARDKTIAKMRIGYDEKAGKQGKRNREQAIEANKKRDPLNQLKIPPKETGKTVMSPMPPRGLPVTKSGKLKYKPGTIA